MMVRYEDGKWINGVGVYFLIIENINDKLYKLIKYKYNNVEEIELLFFDLVVEINRIIPMRSKQLSYADGILSLSQYFNFFEKDFNNLYEKHSAELISMNDVRNKFEHKPHVINWTNYLGNQQNKKIRFVNEEYNIDIIEGNRESIELRKKKKENLEWIVDTNEIVKIVIEVNKIFIKIQEQFKNYFNNHEALEHPYIQRLIQIDFNEYINQLEKI